MPHYFSLAFVSKYMQAQISFAEIHMDEVKDLTPSVSFSPLQSFLMRFLPPLKIEPHQLRQVLSTIVPD